MWSVEVLFFPRTIKRWNNLSEDIVTSTFVDIFKTKTQEVISMYTKPSCILELKKSLKQFIIQIQYYESSILIHDQKYGFFYEKLWILVMRHNVLLNAFSTVCQHLFYEKYMGVCNFKNYMLYIMYIVIHLVILSFIFCSLWHFCFISFV